MVSLSGMLASCLGCVLSGVICLLRGLVLGSCVFLFVVLLNLSFYPLFNIIDSSPAWFV